MTELETLLTGSMDILRRCVHFRLASPHDAEDVMQETLAAVCAAKAYPRDAVRFRAWLLAIARNKIADFLRKKYRRCEVPLDSAAPLGMMPRRLALPWGGMVEEVLSRLPDGDQQLLRMVYWLRLPQTEIARRLGVPTGTVKSRLHHARERFRSAWPENKAKGT